MNKKTMLYLIGSFVFAFLLGEWVHESGHFLLHLIFGHEGVSMVIDPCGKCSPPHFLSHCCVYCFVVNSE